VKGARVDQIFVQDGMGGGGMRGWVGPSLHCASLVDE
jgi:hypothetical protein